MAFPVLLIHGIGRGDTDRTWRPGWERAIREGLVRQGLPADDVEFHTLEYDDLFADAPLDVGVVAEAAWTLVSSLVTHAGPVGARAAPGRPRQSLSATVRWTAGMVAQWAADDGLRAALRARLEDKLAQVKPRLVAAHSLGSLLTYDTFARTRALAEDRWLVTFGSQIGHPAVRSVFGGRVEPLGTRGWYHLFNEEDAAFTARLGAFGLAGLQEVETPFDLPGALDHDGGAYLAHRDLHLAVWPEIADAALGRPPRPSPLRRTPRVGASPPKRRALLVGINEYPDPALRLEGCVNDAYAMSALLQERGYDSADIRVVLDGRATADAIRERLEWLLADTSDESERVLYFSGHGAQLPAYGPSDRVDGLDECLVPVDFDWSTERAIRDDQFYDLYSQLPYNARFTAIFDCCHSGGMTRQGGVRTRGLPLPDDIRHRMLQWSATARGWSPRPLARAEADLTRDDSDRAQALGRSGATKRLGRALPLWNPSATEHHATAAQFGHHGPYMPVLLYACREEEYAFEYRQGAATQGAFTWCLVDALRRRRHKTVSEAIAQVTRGLTTLGYAQHPQVAAPRVRLADPLLGGRAGGDRVL